jgi:hypothetical protein
VEKAYTKSVPSAFEKFTAARECLEPVIRELQSPEAASRRHDETEKTIQHEGQELCRRKIACVFGELSYRRNGYSHPLGESVFPLDEALNMPKRKYGYGPRESVSLAVCQNTLQSSLEGLSTLIAGKVPKRQAEELVVEASTDCDAFYAQRAIMPVLSRSTVLVMSQDGKGIVLRHEDLREATRKAAEKEQHTLSTRLSSGEKRMATVAAVYDVAPHVRTTSEVISRQTEVSEARRKNAPRAENKRVRKARGLEQGLPSSTVIGASY